MVLNRVKELGVSKVIGIGLLVLAVSMVLNAQQYSGTITGTVTDPSGAAVAGAAVTAVNTATGSSYKATTSPQGVYNFAQLPVGTYSIKVTEANFKDYVAKGVEVHTSSTT